MVNLDSKLVKIAENTYEVSKDYKPGMNVPGRVFLSDKLIQDMESSAIEQVANMATLPGIQKYAMAMPDVHVGYGFPIGGVGAFSMENGVISPGGVGFDINCGVRLLKSDLMFEDVRSHAVDLINALYEAVPSGLGSESKFHASHEQLSQVFMTGARWAVENGYGVPADLEHCEENGEMKGADPAKVSKKAFERGPPAAGHAGQREPLPGDPARRENIR